MFNDKPLGLTLAVLYWLTIGGMLISSGGLTLFYGLTNPGALPYTTAFGLVLTLVGIAGAAVAHGLWSLQRWGRGFAFWMTAASIPLAVLAMFPPLAGEASTLDNTLVQIGGIIINGWLLGYLRAETTRSLFASAKHLQQQVK